MEYVIRFLVGGLMVSLFATVGDVLKPKGFAGLFGAAPSVAFATLRLSVFWIAGDYGPVIGGLFLAFPVIFPAGATLLEKHEREKKQRAGIPQTIRGRLAAAIDARGAALGSLGMAGFAFTVWKLLPRYPTVWVLPIALTNWLIVAVIAWRGRELLIDLPAWLRRQRVRS
jgi:hypothetical protein